jgi:DNA mismatch repair protein MutS
MTKFHINAPIALKNIMRLYMPFKCAFSKIKTLSMNIIDQSLQPISSLMPHTEAPTLLENLQPFDSDLTKTRVDIQGLSFLNLYRKLKSQYPSHYLLALQNGDFFEFFDDDAKRAASIAGIVLTKKFKSNGTSKEKTEIPFSGFPVRTLDNFLPKFVKSGVHLILGQQLNNSNSKSGNIQRGITRIITPGTLIEENLLENGSNFILAIYLPVIPKSMATDLLQGSILRSNHKEEHVGMKVGFSWADISTGFLTAEECSLLDLHSLIVKIQPKEIICVSRNSPMNDYISRLALNENISLSFKDPSFFPSSKGKLLADRSGFTRDNLTNTESCALGGIFSILSETQIGNFPILKFTRMKNQDSMFIDSETFKSLEIMNHQSGSFKNSLLYHLDICHTAMGSRLLASRICQPILDTAELDRRLDNIELFIQDTIFLDDIREALRKVTDIERGIQRLSLNRQLNDQKDLLSVKKTLQARVNLVDRFEKQLQYSQSSKFKPLILRYLKGQGKLDDLLHQLNSSLCDSSLSESDSVFNEDYLQKNFTKELRDKRTFISGFDLTLSELEASYRKDLKKASLKIIRTVNEIYLEVNAKDDRTSIPSKFLYLSRTKLKTRYQTLDLIKLKGQLISFQQDIRDAETRLLEELRENILEQKEELSSLCLTLAEIDVSTSMAKLAVTKNYCRPLMSKDSSVLHICDGRHLVVESLKSMQQKNFIENDLIMDKDSSRFHFITGPNMGGKSTFLRQVALIALMAHCGFYVPARSAIIGLTDAIFTRIGAADNLVEDQSTFMMEMKQTAAILHKATSRSLVIMDEIGRGTSYHEGLAIAYGISVYLYEQLSCKTLFATHYHSLGHILQNRLPAFKAFQTSAKILPVSANLAV